MMFQDSKINLIGWTKWKDLLYFLTLQLHLLKVHRASFELHPLLPLELP